MKLITPQQMRMIDKTAIEKLGIPGIVLMENAALCVTNKAASLLENKKDAYITIVAGAGNNGGDAFAVARHLLTLGYIVSVFSMTDLKSLTEDAYTNARILVNMGVDIPIIDEESINRLEVSCERSDLVIDGLLGTGLNRDVDGLWAMVIDIINEKSRLILAIDIASGVDGLTGAVRGKAVKADATVTFFLPKTGMVQYPGASFIGELTVADIGIPYDLVEVFDTPNLLEKKDVGKLILNRPMDGHKGTFGKVLAITGSKGMTGAAYLSCYSAYRTGCGLVKAVIPKSCTDIISVLVPETIIVPMTEKDGHLYLEDEHLLKELIYNSDALLIGPGLSCNEDTHRLLVKVVEFCEIPMVIDADALNIMALDISLLENIRGEAVITPHPAEMARLTGKTTSEIQQDRITIAKDFADEYGLNVVLKGAGTIIASNDGRVSINPTGDDGMATAGAGDVLAGMVLAFLGQGMLPYDAACSAVFLHGLAGEIAGNQKSRNSVIASDIANNICEAFKLIKE
ncbi:MAG: NAD(P)H-hydrate dehydratase [Clostridiaceae bacterium]|nr:NAD(P)H-hydrate dehydratase [Clostridiaceae bacterium]